MTESSNGFYISNKFAASIVAPVVLSFLGVLAGNIVVTANLRQQQEYMATKAEVEQVESELRSRAKFLQYQIDRQEDQINDLQGMSKEAVWHPSDPGGPADEDVVARFAMPANDRLKVRG